MEIQEMVFTKSGVGLRYGQYCSSYSNFRNFILKMQKDVRKKERGRGGGREGEGRRREEGRQAGSQHESVVGDRTCHLWSQAFLKFQFNVFQQNDALKRALK